MLSTLQLSRSVRILRALLPRGTENHIPKILLPLARNFIVQFSRFFSDFSLGSNSISFSVLYAQCEHFVYICRLAGQGRIPERGTDYSWAQGWMDGWKEGHGISFLGGSSCIVCFWKGILEVLGRKGAGWWFYSQQRLMMMTRQSSFQSTSGGPSVLGGPF